MSHRIAQSNQAKLDVAQIILHLSNQSVAVAERFLDSLQESFSFLADFPASGELVDEDDQDLRDVRIWQVKNFRSYLIIFRCRGSTIEILRITHASRDRVDLWNDR
mgnify:CR=1 FL=1